MYSSFSSLFQSYGGSNHWCVLLPSYGRLLAFNSICYTCQPLSDQHSSRFLTHIFFALVVGVEPIHLESCWLMFQPIELLGLGYQTWTFTILFYWKKKSPDIIFVMVKVRLVSFLLVFYLDFSKSKNGWIAYSDIYIYIGIVCTLSIKNKSLSIFDLNWINCSKSTVSNCFILVVIMLVVWDLPTFFKLSILFHKRTRFK